MDGESCPAHFDGVTGGSDKRNEIEFRHPEFVSIKDYSLDGIFRTMGHGWDTRSCVILGPVCYTNGQEDRIVSNVFLNL